MPNQTHQVDLVGPCYLTGPIRFYSLNSIDIAINRCGIEPMPSKAAQSVLDAVYAVWKRMGIPDNLQVDNEMAFFGSPTHPRGMGPLIRLCLLYGVDLWFIPPAEPWRNGVVEKFNDHYRQKFLAKVTMTSHDSSFGRHLWHTSISTIAPIATASSKDKRRSRHWLVCGQKLVFPNREQGSTASLGETGRRMLSSRAIHPEQPSIEHLRRTVHCSIGNSVRIRCGYYRCQRTKVEALSG